MVGGRKGLSGSIESQGLGLKVEGNEPTHCWCLLQSWGKEGQGNNPAVCLPGARQCAQVYN